MIGYLPLMLSVAVSAAAAAPAEKALQRAAAPVHISHVAAKHVRAQATIIRAAIIRPALANGAVRETDREINHRKSGLMIEFY